MKKYLNILKFATFFVLIAAIALSFGASTELAAGISLGINLVSYFLIPRQVGVLGAFVGATKLQDGEVGIQIVSDERERVVYEHNSSQARFSGKNMTPSFLRLEATIVNSTNKIEFKTFEGDAASVYITERRLDRNNAFIATEVAMFLIRQDTTNKKTNAELHSYVNLTTFVAAAGFVPGDLKAIFHGYLEATIGGVKKIPYFDTQRFYKAPVTQQTGATNYDQKNGRKDGFVRLTPQLVIDGSGTNEINVVYPSFAAWAGASVTAGTDHKLVLYFRGLLVTNGSANT